MNYHGIIIDVSQKDNSVLDKLKILSKKKAGNWVLYKVEVSEEKLEKIIKELQENMVEETFYFHFYRNNELIAIFNHKIFRVTTDRITWEKMVDYGKSLGIPEEQLDFKPCRIEDEGW